MGSSQQIDVGRDVAPREKAATAAPAARVSRRRLLARLAAWGAGPVVGGAYATLVEPFWLDVHDVDVAVADLPAPFDGYRIAHLTDLHAGDNLPFSLLRGAVDRVIERRPDAVMLTGDLVTHDAKWVGPLADLLAPLTDLGPVITCLGNHDYDEAGAGPGIGRALADEHVQPQLERRGIAVLRNACTSLARGDARVWVVGMEDLYTRRFYPHKAFAGVPPEPATPVIALTHNPASVKWIGPRKPRLVLAGHTHGGQVRAPFVGSPLLAARGDRYQCGPYDLGWGTMYVSRGVGFLHQVRVGCRPEIPILTLRRSGGA